MDKLIKIILAILLFLCLLHLPYSFYQFVRFTAMIGFLYLSYKTFEGQKQKIAVGWQDIQSKYGLTIVYLILALLFQPLIKIALGRELWNIVDVVVGIYLIASLFVKQKK